MEKRVDSAFPTRVKLFSKTPPLEFKNSSFIEKDKKTSHHSTSTNNRVGSITIDNRSYLSNSMMMSANFVDESFFDEAKKNDGELPTSPTADTFETTNDSTTDGDYVVTNRSGFVNINRRFIRNSVAAVIVLIAFICVVTVPVKKKKERSQLTASSSLMDGYFDLRDGNYDIDCIPLYPTPAPTKGSSKGKGKSGSKSSKSGGKGKSGSKSSKSGGGKGKSKGKGKGSTSAPSFFCSDAPSISPTNVPTTSVAPSLTPTDTPTRVPSASPSDAPSTTPTLSTAPSSMPVP